MKSSQLVGATIASIGVRDSRGTIITLANGSSFVGRLFDMSGVALVDDVAMAQHAADGSGASDPITELP